MKIAALRDRILEIVDTFETLTHEPPGAPKEPSIALIWLRVPFKGPL